MTVSGIGSITNIYQNSVQNPASQRQIDFQQLAQALRSGDLSGARQAYSALQRSIGVSRSIQGTSQSGNTLGSPNDGPFAALTQALRSGDLSGAQQAFAALTAQLHGAHGHRHYGANLQSPATGRVGGDSDSGWINVRV